jgi:hypothetical protein
VIHSCNKTNEVRGALISQNLFSDQNSTCFGFSVHHQNPSTVHTEIGICHTADKVSIRQ